MGHSTDFLTRASLNMYSILTTAQRAELAMLAHKQVNSINEYGYKRFVLMKAFGRLLDGDIPSGATGRDKTAVMKYSAFLFGNPPEIVLPTPQPGNGQPTRQPGNGQPTPQPGNQPSDRFGGRVKSVSGATIIVEDPQGKTTNIVTNASTKFIANGQTAKRRFVARDAGNDQ